jgi:tRNA threonylcarbamoyladenosine biosynthesis protein TsaE
MQLTISSLQETNDFAQKFVPQLVAGDVVELRGDLGSGKTTLAQYIINHLTGSNASVTSPTFNIVQLYPTPEFTIWHFDLYRLESPAELVEIGLEEAFNYGVSLIEWPEIAQDYLPEERLVINLSCGKKNERVLRLEGYGKWKDWVSGIVEV